VQGTVTVPPSAEGAGTGFVDISAIEPLATILDGKCLSPISHDKDSKDVFLNKI